MENISIRPARPSELAAVATLRWEWLVENGSGDLGEPGDFVRHFVTWAEENAGSHRCMVLVRGGRLIGAALDGARELGLERVTVHSGTRAIPAYVRSGFQESPRLLQAQVTRAASV
ncbi:GNAT family N-acetyltransferase [Streptomyces tibetensis]|uniref:GNAT family N-acetyltransferase n=1 Tax=Streptomyces tibetensis TaxID=2382123 RepID=UPI00380D04F8